LGLVWLLLALVVLAEAIVCVIFLRRAHLFAKRWHRDLALAVALGATPVVVLALFVRVAPLDSPYALSQLPGWQVIDANGVVLQRETGDGLRIPVTLDEVAPIMVDATIAAEDERFRDHGGIDPIAVGRALVQLPFHRSGASTLTQQLARRLYIDDSTPLLERKAREALIALQLEARYSKDEILGFYLNNVYYGRGAHGVEAAARVYFGVSAANLDLAQASFLAGLPQRPVEFGESVDSPGVVERQRYVLHRLAQTGRISARQAVAAADVSLHLLPSQAAVVAPHFVGYVQAEVSRLLPELEQRDGLVIETTLDSGLQAEAERQVAFQLAQLQDKAVSNAAVVVLEPASGRVLTMVGSAGFEQASGSGQINMALTPRQPGSALKPFLYAAAFEHGFTAASMLLDVQTGFDTKAGLYEPLNYDRRFHGPVSLRVALASSLNVPAVRTLDAIGLDAFLDMAHRFGLDTLTNSEAYGLALTLGGGEVTLLDLTSAYGALASEGLLSPPYAIERIRDAHGTVLYEHRPSRPTRVLSEQHAFVLADILSDVEARTLGFGYAPTLQMPFRTAVKTGTTSEFRDNWTLGFTPDRAVGVWVGNADNSPMLNVSGIEGAGPIWHGVMEAAMNGVPSRWPEAPPGLARVTVCAPTGLLPGPNCPTPAQEWFLSGEEPRQTEAYYPIGADGRLTIDPPAEARAWAAAAGLALSHASGPEPSTYVVQPGPGAVLYISPELASQEVLLKASPPPDTRRVDFLIDGVLVASASPRQASAVWTLVAGRHELEVRAVLGDGSVVSARSPFEVRP
jgi:penicillin-binding protein 1C